MWRVLSLLMLSAVLVACAAPQTAALRQRPPAAPTAPVYLANVPFFPQEAHQCGPASLASMLQAAGKTVTSAELESKVYVPGREGSFAVEMVAAARAEGRLVYPLAPELAAVLTALEQGYPVLVLQNNGLPVYPVWHFAVVVGADRAQETLWLRSGRTEKLALSFATFERTWARGGHWAVLVLDPARLPDSLDPKVVVRELALMQQAGAVADAQAGFSRALLNWPSQKSAWVGLAQTSLLLGDQATAESTLRELVRREPSYGPGLNNLADLLLHSGRAAEALGYAERAVAVLDIPQTRATLNAIQTRLAAERPAMQIPLRAPVRPPLRQPEPLTAPAP